MANVGNKRPAPDDSDSETNETASADDQLQVTPAKRPALSGFSFRPSPLQQATVGVGFTLKRPTLSAPSTTPETTAKPTTPLQGGGFLKLDSSELKPIAVGTTLAPVDPTSGFSSFGGSSTVGPSQDGHPNTATAGSSEGDSEQLNHTAESQGNLFLQFFNRTSATDTFSSGDVVQNSFASHSSSTNSVTSSTDATTAAVASGGVDNSRTDVSSSDDGQLNLQPEGGVASTGGADSAGLPMSFQGPSVDLPNVQIITGEEKERKIVQVPARLYVFDVLTHTWKERGHGDIRLNDSARSEGVFQSRLVMRTLGSYRLLLNTYLWAHMKCERASQKGIRITAQHGEEGDVGVFLITGASKDIQQLFTAIDRRIEALRRNSSNDNADPNISKPLESASSNQPLPQFEDDDKESLILGEHNSSPESSPDCNVGSRTRHAPAINIATETEQKEAAESCDSREHCDDGKLQIPGESVDGTVSEDRKVGASELSCSSGAIAPDEGVGESDKESESVTPPSSRSLSEEASTTTTISSSTDNATETNFSQ